MSCWKKLISELSVQECRLLVNYNNKALSISTQAQLLSIYRSGLYYKHISPSGDDLANCSDMIYIAHPELGYHRIIKWLSEYEGITSYMRRYTSICEKWVYRQSIRIRTTAKTSPQIQCIFYLLKSLCISHANHVWSIDITYVPVRSSWLYLITIIDGFFAILCLGHPWYTGDRLCSGYRQKPYMLWCLK
jgi:putative transposase